MTQADSLQDLATATTVDVYKNDPVFDTVDRYWMLPMHILQPLAIARYSLPQDEHGEVVEPAKQLAWLRERHPDDLLMY